VKMPAVAMATLTAAVKMPTVAVATLTAAVKMREVAVETRTTAAVEMEAVVETIGWMAVAAVGSLRTEGIGKRRAGNCRKPVDKPAGSRCQWRTESLAHNRGRTSCP